MDESRKSEVTHTADKDHEFIHNAVNKASKDAGFISEVVKELDNFKFPAYKHQILTFVESKSSDKDVIGLLKTLNDSILFRDKYDVKQGLEQENSELKQQYQISDNTRQNLEVEHIDSTEKRKDYPQVPPTAMKNYICNFCGKDFQSKDQLTKHQEFEFKR
ncbi:MAG TPA: hypothetical protein VJS91_11975 [Nitrososphaeraceae archaeon]|nr:hypothetical protein [Nitrososphaeraceae archaeon]